MIPIIVSYAPGDRGFLAGTLDLNDVPGRDELDVFVRETRQHVRSTLSEHDGSWQVDMLDPTVEYDVVGRNRSRTWQDVIVGAVMPVLYPE